MKLLIIFPDKQKFVIIQCNINNFNLGVKKWQSKDEQTQVQVH